MTKGCIFDIEKFAVHDGPGIRNLILMKGCPLQCKWCCNPESQNTHPEIIYNIKKCIGCGLCLSACPHQAIKKFQDKVEINRDICDNCGDCVSTCPSKALNLLGTYMSVDEVISIINVDSPFFWRSGGGITIGGGEPLLQADFVTELLKVLKDVGIHSAIETSGFCEWEKLEQVCRNLDLVLYDIKHMDAEVHKIYTGVTNDLILENLNKISNVFPHLPVIVRVPLIPNVNSSINDVKAITDHIIEMNNVVRCELLPYHSFGQSKYDQLGRDYPIDSKIRINQQDLSKLINIAKRVESNHLKLIK